MIEIIIEASDVWEYVKEHAEELIDYSHIIASNEAYGIEVLVTKDELDDEEFYLSVEQGDEEIYVAQIVDEETAEGICREVYDTYLTTAIFNKFVDEDETPTSYVDIEAEDIESREDDLDFAVEEFVEKVIGEGVSFNDIGEEILNDLKEHFLEYMARKWSIDVYRPMYLYTEKGERFFTEYPYDKMIFAEKVWYIF